ncbi:hypothetical protein [Brevibacillus laterosporus]|uniref:Uncharacterized protein n=1 Tax=Brevibacillus laterosporus TaxID=1465 RepID=A0AAP8U734_BRELA|nr:hypothetical protein [Brevibacillus laterosporus]PPB12931.1 hypothetical protein C4A77_00665 [Brevibacillus laterosporus]
MARKPKCPKCDNEVEKDAAVKHSSKHYHEECYATFIRDRDDRKELIEYTCQLYKTKAPSGMILKQIKEFVEVYGYTYKGITLTLKYFHDTRGNQSREGDGIGIVPYKYEEAKKFFILKRNVERSVGELEGKAIKKRHIKIKSPSLKNVEWLPTIDISKL